MLYNEILDNMNREEIKEYIRKLDDAAQATRELSFARVEVIQAAMLLIRQECNLARVHEKEKELENKYREYMPKAEVSSCLKYKGEAPIE